MKTLEEAPTFTGSQIFWGMKMMRGRVGCMWGRRYKKLGGGINGVCHLPNNALLLLKPSASKSKCKCTFIILSSRCTCN